MKLPCTLNKFEVINLHVFKRQETLLLQQITFYVLYVNLPCTPPL